MKEQIIQFIKKEFHDDSPDLIVESGDDLLSAGLVDSMGMMRLIQYLEQAFDIAIAPEDMTIENFITVDAMATYIENNKEN